MNKLFAVSTFIEKQLILLVLIIVSSCLFILFEHLSHMYLSKG